MKAVVLTYCTNDQIMHTLPVFLCNTIAESWLGILIEPLANKDVWVYLKILTFNLTFCYMMNILFDPYTMYGRECDYKAFNED